MLAGMLIAIRIGTASVWILFGLVFKVLHLLPRHETIVAAVIGPTWAGPATVLIGVAEVGMGLWILSRRWPVACAVAQTLVIVAMNTLEIALAHQHLLTPLGMVSANAVFLTLGWYLAMQTRRRQV